MEVLQLSLELARVQYHCYHIIHTSRLAFSHSQGLVKEKVSKIKYPNISKLFAA